MDVIEVSGLYKIFGPGARERALPLVRKGESKDDILAKTGCTVGINDAAFSIEGGEIFVIMGLSGSGKSTVIRCLNRLIEPTAGEVKIDGVDIVKMGKTELRELRRRKLSMVFQNFGLLPHRSVLDNVAFGLEIEGVGEKERYEKANAAIEKVGLSGYAEMMTQELSGGMQQRVGLARALAGDPEILLMDEAFSALDPLIRVQLQDELLELQAKSRRTVVFITHDLDEALKLGGRIAIMKDGKIVQTGTPEEILSEPADDYVRAFVENVDRSKVITAGAVSAKTEVAYRESGPHQCVRLMRQKGHSALIIVTRERKFAGYISIDDVVALSRKVPEKEDDLEHRNIRSIIRDDMMTISPDTAIGDLIPYASGNTLPIAVVGEDGHFEGIVTRAAILSGMVQEKEAL